MSFAAQRKNITYQSDIEQGIGQHLRVIGDPGRQRQILTNILTNSIKFTSEGYVRLEAPGETVTICRPESSSLTTIVLPSEDLDRTMS